MAAAFYSFQTSFSSATVSGASAGIYNPSTESRVYLKGICLVVC